MSLRMRLLLATISLVVLAILAMGLVSVSVAVNEANDSLTQAAEEKLRSQNSQTAEAVSDYFSTIESQMRTMSNSLTVKDAAQQFVPAFNAYLSQRSKVSTGEVNEIESYYNVEFGGTYNQLNPKKIDNPSSLLSSLGDEGLALQYDFIAGNQFPLGEKDKLNKPNNTSSYAQLHAKYHPDFRAFLQEFGYYDIFIADINTGNVVYSVFKELDFATSLRTGAYANSGLGQAFEMASKATNPEDVFFTQFKPYLPSYQAMAGFVSSPIFVDGKLSAVLIFQMPLDYLNGLLTHDGEWMKSGLGMSGETYLVSQDNKLITQSRFFVEDKKGYLAAIRSKFPQATREIEARDTSIGMQPVESITAKAALKGQTGFEMVLDYRDVEVFSAYMPVKLGSHTIAVLAEIDVAESLAPAVELKSKLLISATTQMVVMVVIAVFVCLWLANRLVKPLTALGETCESLTQGSGDLTIQLNAAGIPEIDRITQSFNTFISQIREIISQVKGDADSLSAASQELSAITAESEAITVQQRDQTNMVATAMEELSASIAEVAHSTANTSIKSQSAQRSLNENMERTNLAADNIKLLVQLINDSSVVISSLKNEVNQISTVLGVITSIADQTNLLALNAAIEAARAGEAGRGFSVVADEVRALATRSQESTVEISKLIDVMNQSSMKSVERMERAGVAADGGIHLVDLVTLAMNELDANLRAVLDLADTVATATEEQNATSDSVVMNVHNINDMAHEVQVGAEQTNLSSG